MYGITATTAAPNPISMAFAVMETRNTEGQGTRSASSIPRLDGKTKRRPRMTPARSVQVLVLFIFVCVPQSLSTAIASTSVFMRLCSFKRLASRPVRMSLRKFHLERFQSVVYLSHRGSSSSFDTKVRFFARTVQRSRDEADGNHQREQSHLAATGTLSPTTELSGLFEAGPDGGTLYSELPCR